MVAILAGMAIVALALFFANSSQASAPAPQRSAAAIRSEAALKREAALKENAKDEAQRFVRVSQNGCRDLTRKIESLTADSVVDFAELNAFIPAEIYPPDAFGVYVGEAAFGDVKGQLSTMVASLVDLLRSLGRNRVLSITGEPRPQQDLQAFQEKKVKALGTTTTYCEGVRRAGAGLGNLN